MLTSISSRDDLSMQTIQSLIDWYLQLLQTFAQEVLTHIDLCSPLLSPGITYEKMCTQQKSVSEDLNVLCGQRFCELSKSFNVHGDEVGGELVLGDVQERAMVWVVHIHLIFEMISNIWQRYSFSKIRMFWICFKPDIIISHLWSRHCERHHCTVARYGKQTHIVL